jgi:hypothetical protein
MVVRRAAMMRRAVPMRHVPALGRSQLLPHQRAAICVPHDLPVAQAVALADRPLGQMHRALVRMSRPVTGCRATMRRGVATRRGTVMRRAVMGSRMVMGRGPVMTARGGRGGRNERRRQLGFGLRLCRLIDGRGLLRSEGRRRNHECGTGESDTQHDNPPIPTGSEDRPACRRRHPTCWGLWRNLCTDRR